MAAILAYPNHEDFLAMIRGSIPQMNPWRAEDPQIDPETLVIDVLLGHGGFAQVYRVTNPKTNITYAVKLIDFPIESDDDEPYSITKVPEYDDLTAAETEAREIDRDENGHLAAKDFREIRMFLKGLRDGHENIMYLEAFATTNIGYALYLEYCDAGTVQSFVQQFRERDEWPPEGFLWHITRQMFSALAFMHKEHPDYLDDRCVQERGVILNPDIKPENVLLKWDPAKTPQTAYPDIKIGDWEGGKILKPGDTLVESAGGSYNTSAPERPFVSFKSDVYSAGATIHWACHRGLFPFEDFPQPRRPRDPDQPPEEASPEPMLDAIDRQERWRVLDRRRMAHDLPGHMSGLLDRIVKRSLIMNPSQRPSAGRLFDEIRRLIDGQEALMFRPLPDWLQEMVADDNLGENRNGSGGNDGGSNGSDGGSSGSDGGSSSGKDESTSGSNGSSSGSDGGSHGGNNGGNDNNSNGSNGSSNSSGSDDFGQLPPPPNLWRPSSRGINRPPPILEPEVRRGGQEPENRPTKRKNSDSDSDSEESGQSQRKKRKEDDKMDEHKSTKRPGKEDEQKKKEMEKKKKKEMEKTQKKYDESSSDEEEEFEVEEILNVKRDKKEIVVQASWLGWPKDLTWFPIDDFKNSKKLLRAYYKKNPRKPKPSWL